MKCVEAKARHPIIPHGYARTRSHAAHPPTRDSRAPWAGLIHACMPRDGHLNVLKYLKIEHVLGKRVAEAGGVQTLSQATRVQSGGGGTHGGVHGDGGRAHRDDDGGAGGGVARLLGAALPSDCLSRGGGSSRSDGWCGSIS